MLIYNIHVIDSSRMNFTNLTVSRQYRDFKRQDIEKNCTQSEGIASLDRQILVESFPTQGEIQIIRCHTSLVPVHAARRF